MDPYAVVICRTQEQKSSVASGGLWLLCFSFLPFIFCPPRQISVSILEYGVNLFRPLETRKMNYVDCFCWFLTYVFKMICNFF